MASNTPKLGLLKKDPAMDGNETFNIQTMLNDNWDKIDEAVGNIEVPEASTTQKGIVQLSNATDGEREDVAATERAVKAAYERGSEGATASEAAMLKVNEVGLKVDTHLADYTLQIPYAVTTGTANVYAISLPIPTLFAGMAVTVKINVASTAASTLNWNSKGAKGLKKADGTDITNLKANGVYTFRYDGTNFIVQGEGGEYGTATPDKVSVGYTIAIENNGIQSGTFTADATATAVDIAAGKTAYVNGVRLTGMNTKQYGPGDTIPIEYLAEASLTELARIYNGGYQIYSACQDYDGNISYDRLNSASGYPDLMNITKNMGQRWVVTGSLSNWLQRVTVNDVTKTITALYYNGATNPTYYFVQIFDKDTGAKLRSFNIAPSSVFFIESDNRDYVYIMDNTGALNVYNSGTGGLVYTIQSTRTSRDVFCIDRQTGEAYIWSMRNNAWGVHKFSSAGIYQWTYATDNVSGMCVGTYNGGRRVLYTRNYGDGNGNVIDVSTGERIAYTNMATSSLDQNITLYQYNNMVADNSGGLITYSAVNPDSGSSVNLSVTKKNVAKGHAKSFMYVGGTMRNTVVGIFTQKDVTAPDEMLMISNGSINRFSLKVNLRS